jgi:hypothetical protein
MFPGCEARDGKSMSNTMGENKKLAVCEGKRIRNVLHEREWWFPVIDLIEALVGGDRPRKYRSELKQKLISEGVLKCPKKSDS